MMTVAEERLKILQMLEDGKISAEEAAGLLRALEGAQRAASSAPFATIGASEGRNLRVQVSDLTTGAPRVNVTVPMRLVSVGLRIAERFAPEGQIEGLDRGEIEALLAAGALGKVMEVTDTEDNERIEIFVE